MLTHPSSHLDCIDTFEGSYEHDLMGMNLAGLEERFRHNIAPHQERVSVFRGPSSEMMFRPEIRNHRSDFAYVDGCHEAKEVLEDAVLAFSLLKPGGILLFDDYTWGPADALPLICPRPAVDAFTTIYGLHAEVLQAHWAEYGRDYYTRHDYEEVDAANDLSYQVGAGTMLEGMGVKRRLGPKDREMRRVEAIRA